MKIDKDEESRNNVTVPVYRSTDPLANVLDSTASRLQVTRHQTLGFY